MGKNTQSEKKSEKGQSEKKVGKNTQWENKSRKNSPCTKQSNNHKLENICIKCWKIYQAKNVGKKYVQCRKKICTLSSVVMVDELPLSKSPKRLRIFFSSQEFDPISLFV